MEFEVQMYEKLDRGLSRFCLRNSLNNFWLYGKIEDKRGG